MLAVEIIFAIIMDFGNLNIITNILTNTSADSHTHTHTHVEAAFGALANNFLK